MPIFRLYNGGEHMRLFRMIAIAAPQFRDQLAHPKLAAEPQEARVALELHLGNVAVVNLPDRAVAQLSNIGLVPVPGKRNTDEDRDDDHQALMVLADYSNHGLDRVGVANLGPHSDGANGFCPSQ